MEESLEYQRSNRILYSFTNSFIVNSNSLLTSEDSDLTIEKRIARCVEILVGKTGFKSRNIEELANDISLEPAWTSVSPIIPQTIRYKSFRFSQSDFLDYEGKKRSSTITDAIAIKFSRTGEPIYNEWAIVPSQSAREELSVAYNIVLTMGIQRSIFVSEMGSRIFNVLLPPGKIKSREKKPEDSPHQVAYQEEVSNFLIIPIITLVQQPKKDSFRKTVSLSLLLIPTDESFSMNRMITSHEIKHMANETYFEICDSSLKSYLLANGIQENESFKLLNLLIQVTRLSYQNLSGYEYVSERDLEKLNDEVSISLRQTIGILSDSIKEEDVKNFYGKSPSKNLYTLLNLLIFPEWHLSEYPKRPDAVDFSNVSIKDRSGINTGYFVFFNPDTKKTIFIMSSQFERTSELSKFFEFSIRWASFWYLYIDVSISSLRTMIHSFYNEIANERGAKALLTIEEELIEDIEEFYELGINSFLFKDIYKRLRELAGLDEDFKVLKEKLEALKTNVVIKDQRVTNRMLILLTIVLIIVTATLIVLKR
ncbi:MAG: hypothetical protein M1161_02370 [Candidatus Thermoplasmatota archaeon]|nr:hypothetical protein [Candidatus Thermoplasmatota archaeon]